MEWLQTLAEIFFRSEVADDHTPSSKKYFPLSVLVIGRGCPGRAIKSRVQVFKV